ncbi:hypothetical protein BTHE68_34990 [Burkholderia sp. THE68]|nr:hypothetical protein BTHE68_34990 [Burkholderia sp. THE68]
MTLAEREQTRFFPLRVDARDDRDIAERMRTERHPHGVFDRIRADAAPASNSHRESRDNGFHVDPKRVKFKKARQH